LPLVTAPADLNKDCFVDLNDIPLFAACAGGPNVPYADGCPLGTDTQGFLSVDFDHDHDIDLADFGIFQRCLSGSLALARLDCPN
jgi:hypothetical protein